ncbi:MAG: ABC transporter substrate-binding protein [Cyanobacteria bacterium P01_D01_bin.44]
MGLMRQRLLRRIGSMLFWRRFTRRVALVMLAGVVAIATTSCSLSNFKTEAADVPQIVYSILSDPKTFNYALSQERPNIFPLTYSGLITEELIAEDGEDGQIVPDLAESWQFSDDGMTLTFTLKEGLQWSDGEPLTAADVDFTFNQVLFNEDIPTDNRDGLRVGESGQLPTIKALDDRRIEVSITEPFAPLLRQIGVTAILPKHALEDTITNKDSEGNPVFLSTWTTSTPPREVVCSGPYMLDSFLPGERVIFRRNPYYWQKGPQGEQQPYIERVIWQVVESQDSEFIQFRSGGLDLMSIKPDNFSLVKREEDRGNFTVYNGGPAPGVLFITFNLNKGSRNGKPLVDPIKSKWFNQVEFRQAVAYSINRQAMLNNIYQGLGILQDSPVLYQSAFYAGPEDGIPAYEYNPDKAKELLESVGFNYNAQGQLLDDAGNRVRFTLITNSGNKVRELIIAQIAQDLAEVGIQVDIKPISFGALVEKLSDSLEWESHVISFGGGGLDPHGGTNVWNVDGGLHAFNQKPQVGQEPIEGREVAPWEQEISDLFIEGSQELDEEKRKAIYYETQRLTQENLPFIYLVNQYSMVAIRNKIDNVKYSPLGSLWNIYELKISED